MTATLEKETPKTSIGEKRERYLAYSKDLMVVVIDFDDGPMEQPDEPHSHPHQQITYVAEGELFFFINGEKTRLQAGDIMVVPPDAPHTIQLISEHVRLVDTFSPIREDFL
ncbi:MAG: cupin domain-containing protein [Proteobacteria bacterium]|nr:cupin domain-containing protein [Pseudomonadota bacterium]